MEKQILIGKNIKIQYNSKLFIQGCILTAFGIIFPFLIMEKKIGVYNTLHEALIFDSASLLLFAAMKLVIMNTMRAIPHYLGVFLINESVHIYIYNKKRFVFNTVFTISLILLIYNIINCIHGIKYDFGIPALIIVAFVLLLSYMNLFSVSMINKVLIVTSLLLSIQWLDIIPMLSKYYFGRGEISMDVKIAAEVSEEGNLLGLFAICMFSVFLYAALIQVQLLYKEHKLKISNEKTRNMEKELYNVQIEALKLRNYSEVQGLVHDLKSPLTTIQGLISLAEIMEKDNLLREYFKKISDSLTSMSMMISEILYENKKFVIDMEDVIKMVLAQLSILVPNGMLEYKNDCKNAKIFGNKIRLSRAIVNIITNSYNAVDKKNGKISLKTFRFEGNIYIIIKDNGVGIAPENMENIWKLGYSERHSTGLGLAFARQVIEGHNGTIEIESRKDKYTEVIICLKENK